MKYLKSQLHLDSYLILIPLVFTCSKIGAAGLNLNSNITGTWYCWEKMCEVNKSGKTNCFMDGDKVGYSLNILEIDSIGNIGVTKLPAFIKNNDTVYSASDGGFFYGNGNLSMMGSMMKISGRFSKIKYARIKDSTFQFGVNIVSGKLVREPGGDVFLRTSKAFIRKLRSNWD